MVDGLSVKPARWPISFSLFITQTNIRNKSLIFLKIFTDDQIFEKYMVFLYFVYIEKKTIRTRTHFSRAWYYENGPTGEGGFCGRKASSLKCIFFFIHQKNVILNKQFDFLEKIQRCLDFLVVYNCFCIFFLLKQKESVLALALLVLGTIKRARR